jgi:copper chaperone CopZ
LQIGWAKAYIDGMDSFTISGMTCAGCARKVEAALKGLAADAIVTLEPPRVAMTGVSLDQVNAALATIGKYRASAGVTVGPAFAVPAEVKAYYPLALVMGLIALASFAGESWMMGFMAGFYLVFGAFKLLDVPGFANAYAGYDVVAKVFKPWGYAYPVIELALGFAFLFYYQMNLATWIALMLSLVGAVGVIQSVMRKETIQCACLGTVFNLPMSTVTIVENLGMAAMAAWMLIVGM